MITPWSWYRHGAIGLSPIGPATLAYKSLVVMLCYSRIKKSDYLCTLEESAVVVPSVPTAYQPLLKPSANSGTIHAKDLLYLGGAVASRASHFI